MHIKSHRHMHARACACACTHTRLYIINLLLKNGNSLFHESEFRFGNGLNPTGTYQPLAWTDVYLIVSNY